MFISTKKLRAKHKQTPLDIYYSNLEEAYGNLPVPDDDWAGIGELLGDKFEKDELEQAIEVIRNHYEDVAKALGKEQKYG